MKRGEPLLSSSSAVPCSSSSRLSGVLVSSTLAMFSMIWAASLGLPLDMSQWGDGQNYNEKVREYVGKRNCQLLVPPVRTVARMSWGQDDATKREEEDHKTGQHSLVWVHNFCPNNHSHKDCSISAGRCKEVHCSLGCKISYEGCYIGRYRG